MVNPPKRILFSNLTSEYMVRLALMVKSSTRLAWFTSVNLDSVSSRNNNPPSAG